MYPQPGQTGTWNPNGPPPPPSSSAQPQQGNAQWAPPPMQQPQQQQQQQQQHQQQQHQQHQGQHQQPQQHQQQPQQNGQYAPQQQQQQRPPNQIPPITQGNSPQGPTMTTMQPQHPDQYRSLPPLGPQYGHPQYHQQPPMQYPPQPAPRQRTAIACRYCRRRKIRCSGFAESEDGRCTNCQRFSQECVFTPVSAQTQAFVPAHTVWRNQGAVPQQLYGAYGQPLPQGQIVREYAPPQQPYNPQNGQYQQQPQYGPPGQHPQQGGPPQQNNAQSPNQQPTQAAGQKRPTDEPHTPTLPPPNPAHSAQMPLQQRSASGEHVQSQQQYVYPDPSSLTNNPHSPASSATSHYSGQPHAQPYYTNQAPPPRSPQPGSYYEQQLKQERASASPQNRINTPGGYPAPNSDGNLRPPQGQDGRSSPSNGSASRQGVRINELVGPNGTGGQQSQGGEQQQAQPQQGQQTPDQSERHRSSADSDMLGQLNKRSV